MAETRKANGNGKSDHAGLKRLAVGTAVVGAFAAGAYAGINKNKVKAFAKKTGRTVKSKLRTARAAAVNKAADVRDRVRERVAEARDRVLGSGA